MRAQTLPAAAGWRWLTGGFAIYRRNPPLLTMLTMTYWFTALLLQVLAAGLPVVGAVLVSLVMPGLSVGLMQACRGLDDGQAVGLPTLYGGIRQNPRVLMLLGLLYFFAIFAVVGLASLPDDGAFLRAMAHTLTSGQPLTQEALANASPLASALIFALLATPLLMAYWYAPMLAAWHGLPAFKSLFFSLVSCWLNWRAFFVYALGLFAVMGLAPFFVLALLAVLFPDARGLLAVLITIPMILVMVPSLFASFYVSYRDVFIAGVSESA